MQNKKTTELACGQAFVKRHTAAELAAIQEASQAGAVGREERVRAAWAEAEVDLEAHGFTLPRSIEQFQELALAVGLPESAVWSGDFTLGELRPLAARWAARARARLLQEQAYRALQAEHGIVPAEKPTLVLSRGVVRSKGWTQTDLNQAIRGYRAARSRQYEDLSSGVEGHFRGAKEAAVKVFGRNAIARELQAPPAMVGASEVWQEIAEKLELRHKRGQYGSALPRKIGLEAAIDAKAVADGDTTAVEVERRETLQLLNQAMKGVKPEDRADIEAIGAIGDDLQAGRMTDDEARETLLLFGQQRTDRNARRALDP